MTDVLLSLGSNLGNRLAWLKRAGLELLSLPKTRVTAFSPVYETDPVDVPLEFEGFPFLNCVAAIETELAPEALASAVHAIEERLGRTRGPQPSAPRTIDIDLLAYGGLRMDTPALTLPHPRARERRFVLQPLADLRPDYIFPGDELTVSELLRGLPPVPSVRRYP